MAFSDALRRHAGQWATFTLAPLGFPVFRAIWSASLATNLGGIIQSIGASWLMVSLDPSPATVALVQTANTAPLMCFSLLAGALADTMDRRVVMISAMTFCMLSSIALAFASLFHMLTPFSLLVFTFLVAAGNALYTPAWQASVSETAPPDVLPQAVALNALSFNAARSVAPAIGAEIVALFGATVSFFINAVSYIGMITVLARWKRPMPALHGQSLLTAMSDGLRFVTLSPSIMCIMGRGFLFGLGASALSALAPVLAHTLNGGPRALGALLGCFGLGAMGGALTAAQLRARLTSDGLVTIACIALSISMVVLGFARSLPFTLPPMIVAGACFTMALSTLNISVQQSSPRWVSGRTIAVYLMVTFGGMAGGSALWGVVARAIGVFETYWVVGATFLVVAAIGRFMRIPDIRVADTESRAASVAAPAEEMDPRAGPIVINLEYRVAPSDAPAFLIAVRALGRLRRRDGARDWSLMQDIDDPTLWIERFHSPTWRDYLHRLSRPIAADDPIRAQVRLLTQGPPVLKRRLDRPVGARPLGAPRAPETPSDDMRS